MNEWLTIGILSVVDGLVVIAALFFLLSPVL